MKVRYTDTAADEVEQILAYVAERNPAAAVRLMERLERIVTNLGDFPERR